LATLALPLAGETESQLPPLTVLVLAVKEVGEAAVT
jgi:hypothetical protein